MILKKYTNELLRVIGDRGYDVNDFSLERPTIGHLGEGAKITYKKTDFHYVVMPGDSARLDIFKVGFVHFIPNLPYGVYPTDASTLTFDEVKNNLIWWLNDHLGAYLQNEEETDYWKLFEEAPISIEGTDFTENEPFKSEEKELLLSGLDEIKIHLAQGFDLTEQQIEIVNKKIDYLKAATNRVSKTDWKVIAITIVASIAYDFAFDEQKRAALIGLFSKLWAIVQHLPPHLG